MKKPNQIQEEIEKYLEDKEYDEKYQNDIIEFAKSQRPERQVYDLGDGDILIIE
jgi:hypothetical protein